MSDHSEQQQQNHHPPAVQQTAALAEEPIIATTAITFRSKYPGILDYDALKYRQLRHQFREHDFLALQWKAMQLAGWRYQAGQYKSPPGGGGGSGDTQSVVWGSSPNAINAQLDRCAVSPIAVSSNNMQPPSQQPMSAVDDDDDGDCDKDGKERVEDLRNDILYHMQLITEKSRRGRGDNDSGDENPDFAAGASANDDDNSSTQPLLRVLPKRATRAALKVDGSATVVEKGSDLYLHKKGRKVGSKKKRAQDAKNNNSSSSSADQQDLPAFPTLAECAKLMRTFDVTACEAIEAYYAQHCFSQWRHMLSTNHSLLLYGNGSKYDLLSKFCKNELSKEGYVLQIDGFDPDVTIDAILDLLVTLFLDDQDPDPRECDGLFLRQIESIASATNIPQLHTFRNPITAVDRAVCVARALSKRSAETGVPVFLVIHSLEGKGLCTDLAQAALAAMVRHAVPDGGGGGQAAAIRLVASVDHVDASAALWSCSTTAASVCWWRQEIHTYRPYVVELAMLADQDVSAKKAASKQNRATEQAARVLEVLKNLAPRYGEVMQILAKLQLNELKSSSKSPWVDYKVFRTECKSGFIIDKESKLRTLQTELTDHRLMISKTEGPSEFVSIPYNEDKLKEIIAFKRSADK